MKKRVFLFALLVVLFSVSFVLADNSTSNTTAQSFGNSSVSVNSGSNSNSIDNAYQCLQNQVDSKNSFSLGEAFFGTLALGSNSKLEDKINELESSDGCWPSGSCTIRETALGLLTYNRVGKPTNDIVSWLETKNHTANGLNWYLEVNINNQKSSTCTLTYDNRSSKISVGSDMRISGNPGSCFEITNSGYWLQFRDNCVGKEVKVSCDQDFLTALVYQKSSGGTIFVSPSTQSSVARGTTSEKVVSQCFSINGQCDYEGTLWAALALNKVGKDVSAFIPYISALAPDNEKYFPESFLYAILGDDNDYSAITGSQKNNRYWIADGSPYNLYYDSALALLAIGGKGADVVQNSENYFEQINKDDGCWNNDNIRDTAFLLYAGWPRAVSTEGGSEVLCSSLGGFCGSQFACLNQGGQVLNQAICSDNTQEICCSVNPIGETCSEQQGQICSAGEVCQGSTSQSSDSASCCLGSCVPFQNQTQSPSCSSVAGTCRSSCLGSETTGTESCSIAGQVCCIPSNLQPVESGSHSLIIWIVILIILILIVILAIVYRNKIRLWWHKMKGNAGSSPIPPPGRGPPPRGSAPSGQTRNGLFRRPAFGSQGPVPRRAPFGAKPQGQNKEMEDTFRKLREMSK